MLFSNGKNPHFVPNVHEHVHRVVVRLVQLRRQHACQCVGGERTDIASQTAHRYAHVARRCGHIQVLALEYEITSWPDGEQFGQRVQARVRKHQQFGECAVGR